MTALSSVLSRRNAQRGQMMPFAAAFLVMIAALFYFAVNTGELSVEKTRVVNAADAAAYSAGVVQARALNLTAYTNRAIIANQMAVAQSLSLVNELNHLTSFYSATDADVVDTLLEGAEWSATPNPTDRNAVDRYVRQGAVTAGSLIGQFYGFEPEEFIEEVLPWVNAVGSVVITAEDWASLGLESSMRALWAPGEYTLNDRAMDAGRMVARIMDPKIELQYSASALTSAAPSIVKLYDDDDRDRLQDVVLRSRSPYLVNRDENVYSAEWAAAGIHTGFERRGSTSMSDLDTWQVSDTQDYRYHNPSFWNWRRTSTEDIEGARATITGGQDGETEAYYRAYVDNEEQIDWFFAQYHGMASVYDIEDKDDTSATQDRPGFTIYAAKKKVDTKTSGHDPVISPSGELALFDAVPSLVDELGAMSRAEIIFHRPPRDDGKTEYPNLYNPFWTVRLTTPTALDYATFAVAKFW